MTLPINVNLAEPTPIDTFNALMKRVMLTLKCHNIAQVVSFDPGVSSVPPVPTVQAKIVYTKTFIVNTKSGYSSEERQYQTLVKIPVFIPSGGSCSLTFPIKGGEFALICHNDRDLSNWLKGATSGPVASARLHSISDGIAFVGLFNSWTGNPTYDLFRAVLTDGAAKMAIGKVGGAGASLNEISTVIGGSLGSNLSSVITALSTAFSGMEAAADTNVSIPATTAVASLNALKIILAKILI